MGRPRLRLVRAPTRPKLTAPGGSVVNADIGIAVLASKFAVVMKLSVRANLAAIEVRGSANARVARNFLQGANGVWVDSLPGGVGLVSDDLVVSENDFRQAGSTLGTSVLMSASANNVVVVANRARGWRGHGLQLQGNSAQVADNAFINTAPSLPLAIFSPVGVRIAAGGANARIERNELQGFDVGIGLHADQGLAHSNRVVASTFGSYVNGNGNALRCNQFHRAGATYGWVGGIVFTAVATANSAFDNTPSRFAQQVVDHGSSNSWSLQGSACP